MLKYDYKDYNYNFINLSCKKQAKHEVNLKCIYNNL